jgi:uncharacterized protein YdaU (DUF1376 family)
MNWYPHNPDDFRDGTLKLTLEEIGAYQLLIDALHKHEDGLDADDLHLLANVLNSSTRVARRLVASLISHDKLYVKDGKLRNPRTDRDIEKFRSNLGKTSGKRGQKTQRNQSSSTQNLESRRKSLTEISDSPTSNTNTAAASRQSNRASRDDSDLKEASKQQDRENVIPLVAASDLASDDHKVIIRYAELRQMEEDLPHIKNLRGQARYLLRSINSSWSPEARLREFYKQIHRLEQYSAERDEVRKAKAATAPKPKTQRKPTVQWEVDGEFS